MSCKVGTFAKSTAAASVDQAITGVGFQPWAIIMWTVGATANESWTDSYLFSFGMAGRNAAGTITQGSVASASQDAQATSNSTRSHAAKAMTICQWGESTLAECSMKSFDADGFTLTWTTNNATAYVIHYMAIGGPNVTNAYVKAWSTGSGTGDKAITGIGFQPTCAIHASTNLSTALTTTADIFIGMMTAAAQGGSGFRADDSSATTGTYRVTTNTKTVDTLGASGLTYIVGTYKSFGADGFTVNLSYNSASTPFYTLCLAGGDFAVGTMIKSVDSAPASQSDSSLSFEPEGVMFLSAAYNGDLTNSGVSQAYFTLGATDGTTEGSSCLSDKSGSADSIAKCYDTTGKAICLTKNSTPEVSAECDTTSLDADGWTVNWTTNYTTSPGDFIQFFAFSDPVAATGGAYRLTSGGMLRGGALIGGKLIGGRS